jgi:hypothetical protein
VTVGEWSPKTRQTGMVAWRLGVLVSTVLILEAVHPVNHAAQCVLAWCYTHASTLADQLDHHLHRIPPLHPTPAKHGVLAGDGMGIAAVAAALVLAVAVRRASQPVEDQSGNQRRSKIANGVRIAVAVVALLALVAALAAQADASRPAVAAVLRFAAFLAGRSCAAVAGLEWPR